MKLTVMGRETDLVRLACSGTVSAFTLPERNEMWTDALGADGYTRAVLLDLSAADYLDSSGVSWLIIAHRRFRQAGGRLVLHSLPPRLREMVELLRLPSILDVAADEAAARSLLREAKP